MLKPLFEVFLAEHGGFEVSKRALWADWNVLLLDSEGCDFYVSFFPIYFLHWIRPICSVQFKVCFTALHTLLSIVIINTYACVWISKQRSSCRNIFKKRERVKISMRLLGSFPDQVSQWRQPWSAEVTKMFQWNMELPLSLPSLHQSIGKGLCSFRLDKNLNKRHNLMFLDWVYIRNTRFCDWKMENNVLHDVGNKCFVLYWLE